MSEFETLLSLLTAIWTHHHLYSKSVFTHKHTRDDIWFNQVALGLNAFVLLFLSLRLSPLHVIWGREETIVQKREICSTSHSWGDPESLHHLNSDALMRSNDSSILLCWNSHAAVLPLCLSFHPQQLLSISVSAPNSSICSDVTSSRSSSHYSLHLWHSSIVNIRHPSLTNPPVCQQVSSVETNRVAFIWVCACRC